MISLNWVKDYIDIENEDLKELAVKITKAGINVESVITNHIDNLVIGKVLEVKKHPDSDHLNICIVDVKDEKLQIVCGASNVRENLKVIVAKPKAILPGNIEIKRGKIRGVESDGMICALFELGLEEKNEENYAKGITELDDQAAIGGDPLKFLNLDDTLYELDVHKHRNNDCYYHIGFAYEIAAILGKKVSLPNNCVNEIEDKIDNYFKLDVKTDKCPLYLARMVKNIKVGESPDFIKKRLISAGMRPINNVVDISNYVMLEYGQPLHFFDKEKLGDKISVTMANNNEQITTLDGKERILTKDDIIITDNNKPVCIAGVMGGISTEVDENTTSILIESAIFNSVNIRNTSQRLNLKSEASVRYGKGLNYEYTYAAINRACYLLEKYASGKVLSNTIVYDNIDKSKKIVKFKSEDVNKILGIIISDEDMKKELEKLNFEYEYNNKEFIITIPPRRLDIDPNVADIAEEIGRLYGYHNLIPTLPKQITKKGSYVGDVFYRKTVSQRLRSLGLDEVKTYTLTSKEMINMFRYEDKKNIILPNPMSSDKAYVRTSVLPSLINTYDYNKKRQVKDINIYEISKTYDSKYNEDCKIAILMSGNYMSNQWQKNYVKTDYYVLKGILESVLDYLGLKNRYDYERLNNNNLHPKIAAKILLDRQEIGVMGKVHPSICKDDVYVLEISLTKLITKVKPLKYKEPAKYPSIIKDVSFVVDKKISTKEIEKVIKKTGGKLLTNIEVFDLYMKDKVGENEKSIAYSLTFNDESRTLTENEVMEKFREIIKNVKEQIPATVRDN